MKRVIVFKNGTDVDGKVLLVTHSLEELLTASGNKFNITAKRIFTQKGGEIDDIKLIRDDDILYVSAGEAFVPQGTTTNGETPSVSQSETPQAVSKPKAKNSHWVTLNVGGKYFTTSRSTLVTKEPNSMLARMFAEGDNGYLMTPSNVDSQGAYLIDRSPTYFEPILNYLRNGQLIFDSNVNVEGILEEARFFGVESVIPQLENLIAQSQQTRDNLPLSRRDVINALIMTPFISELRFQGVNLAGSDLSRLDLRYINFKEIVYDRLHCLGRYYWGELMNISVGKRGISHNHELRFQGVNLAGADLSRLDLRHINFKYACLHGCRMTGANLSWCSLERADLSHAILEGAQLLGVKMLCANLEGANLRACNFEDPAGTRANMEGVNLKGAVLEGSNMAGVNLRVATLKGANLKNCDLRAAVLAGADLQSCDLSGSDLQEANLRGANLKDAAFELMLTPLHMSQTVR